MALIATLTALDFESDAWEFAPTALVYSAANNLGWGDLVYLSGNISDPGEWSLGIMPWDSLQAIGGVVVVIQS